MSEIVTINLELDLEKRSVPSDNSMAPHLHFPRIICVTTPKSRQPHYEYESVRNRASAEVTLPSDTATRLGAFFMLAYSESSSANGKRPNGDSFVAYMKGITYDPYATNQDHASMLRCLRSTPTDPDLTKPYSPYALLQWTSSESTNVQSVFALEGGLGLSIRESDSSLILARNRQLMEACGAQALYPLIQAYTFE